MRNRVAHFLRGGALLAVIAMPLTGCVADDYYGYRDYGYRDGTRGAAIYTHTSPSYYRYSDQGHSYYQPTPQRYRGQSEYWRDHDDRDDHQGRHDGNRRDCDDDRHDHQGWNDD